MWSAAAWLSLSAAPAAFSAWAAACWHQIRCLAPMLCGGCECSLLFAYRELHIQRTGRGGRRKRHSSMADIL